MQTFITREPPATSRLPLDRAEGVVLLLSALFYLALASWMSQTWKPLGDEPHYLLAAHSLVFDHDLDLSNNYDQGDYRRFLEGESIDRHIKLTADGQQVFSHDLGLPFLIAVPYALGARAGVGYFLALIAALLALQIFKLARAITGSARIALLTWLALAFTPPLLLYAFLIYPELIGALFVVWATRTLVLKPSRALSSWQIGLLAVALAGLPWLSFRYFTILALLLIFTLIRAIHVGNARLYSSRCRSVPYLGAARRYLPILIVVGLSICAYFLVNNVVLAGRTVTSRPGVVTSESLASLSPQALGRGLLGWWLDPQRGTLILSPIYLLALAGIPRLLRSDLWKRIGLILPLLLLNLFVSVLGGFWIAFEVGARYLVIALPLLAAPLALALQAGLNRARPVAARALFGAFALLLAAISGLNGAWMVGDASNAYGSVVTAYNRVVGRDLSPFFASMGHAVQFAPRTPLPEGSPPNVSVANVNGEPFWHVAPGAPGIILNFDFTDLTVGNYNLTWVALSEVGGGDTLLLSVDVFSAEGLQLVHALWNGGDTFEESLINFDNPYFDRWGFPLTLQVRTSGEAALELGAFTLDPDTPTMWLRAALWVMVVLAIIVILNLDLLLARQKTITP